MSKEKKKKEKSSKKKGQYKEEMLWHLLLGFWMLGIFILSGIEGSGETHFDVWMLIERKGAHVIEFFVMAYLFWKVLGYYQGVFGQRIVRAFLFSLLYASLDEFHQLFVFGREGKVTDVGIDAIGIAFSILAIFAIINLPNKKRSIWSGNKK